MSFAEYSLKFPKMIDEFLDNVVLEANKKINNPTKFITKEGLLILIIRDWYANQVLPKMLEDAQKTVAEKFGKNLEKIFMDVYK